MFTLDSQPPFVPLLIIFSYNIKSNMHMVVKKLISKANIHISNHLQKSPLATKAMAHENTMTKCNNNKFETNSKTHHLQQTQWHTRTLQ